MVTPSSQALAAPERLRWSGSSKVWGFLLIELLNGSVDLSIFQSFCLSKLIESIRSFVRSFSLRPPPSPPLLSPRRRGRNAILSRWYPCERGAASVRRRELLSTESSSRGRESKERGRQ